MQEAMWWFWRANIDYHGTTMSCLVAEYPDTWQDFIESDLGQKTAADTIPARVAGAAARHVPLVE
jgi:hypothetical protein